MRYSVTQYANIFSSLLEKTPRNHRKEAIKEFALMLEQNGDLKNESEILYAVEQILYRDSKSLKVEVTEAKSHHVNVPDKIDYKTTDVKKTIDPNLIGGIKIKIGDTIIDNSIISRINNLKQAFK